MALTGVWLIGFVVVHMLGNLLVYACPDALNGYAKEGFSAEFSGGGGRPSIGMMSIERAIYDFLASLVFDQLFDRFPNLRVASVEKL